jgi:hypothetical protein
MWICFSGMAGGGVYGKVVGISHSIMTGDGAIITISRNSIMMSTRGGGDITETVIGTDTGGTTNPSLTNNFDRTGEAGTPIAIGSGTEPGEYRTINRDRCSRDRS